MNKKGLVGVVISIILVVVIIGGYVIAAYTSVDNTTITIKDKERITTSSESYYLVFTEDEVYKNTDSLLMWKFDSSNVYNDLEIGKTYNVKTNWFRVPFFSMYKNIIEIN